MDIKEQIEFSDFLEIEKKLDIRAGQVVAAERVAKSDKLLKLTVIFGAEEADEKTVVTNLGQDFEPDDFLGQMFQFIVNLKPSKMMGITSEAMIMVAKNSAGGVDLTNFSMGSKIL